MPTINHTEVLNTEQCCNCGVLFAMPAQLQEHRRNVGGRFYCPNGHSMVYTKNRLDKAIEERDEALRKLSAKSCELANERNAREKIEQGLKRLKHRIKNGVCPCCKRSFQNLRRHMTTQHPEFSPQ